MATMTMTQEQADRQWRAQQDARTLAEAEAIKADAARMKEAQRGAQRLHVDAEKTAKSRAAEAAALRKIAKGSKAPKKTAKKAPPRPAKTTKPKVSKRRSRSKS